MDDLEKKILAEILKNQFVIAHQMLVIQDKFNVCLGAAGEYPLKKKHKCKMLEDAVKRTRELLKEIEQ